MDGPKSLHADLILVGRVVEVKEVDLLPIADPDRFFIGYLYSFRTLARYGERERTIDFVGWSPRCPASTTGDQVYLVFLENKTSWAVVGYDYLFSELSACSRIDEESSTGFIPSHN